MIRSGCDWSRTYQPRATQNVGGHAHIRVAKSVVSYPALLPPAIFMKWPRLNENGGRKWGSGNQLSSWLDQGHTQMYRSLPTTVRQPYRVNG